MTDFFVFYTLANVVCFIIFGIMLVHDLIGMDRRETQIKYDKALIAFMLYFAADCLWAAATADVIKPSMPLMIFVHFSIYVLMSAITYTWLRYVMAFEDVEGRDRPIKRFAILFPFLVSTIILVVLFVVAPDALIGNDYEAKPLYSVFLVVVPYIYIIAVIIYTAGKAKRESNPVEKKRHINIGIFPLLLVASGLVQMIWLPNVPFYCFASTIFMLIIYIQSMDNLISMDPLTRLNNRGQLMRYVSQSSNMFREDSETYIMMIDVNYFKMINDTYGHAEGDRALRIISGSLKKTIRSFGESMFLSRYGGDEFVLVVHTEDVRVINEIISSMRSMITEACRSENTPYELTVAIGFDKLTGADDTFQKCMQRADHNMYINKKEINNAGAV